MAHKHGKMMPKSKRAGMKHYDSKGNVKKPKKGMKRGR